MITNYYINSMSEINENIGIKTNETQKGLYYTPDEQMSLIEKKGDMCIDEELYNLYKTDKECKSIFNIENENIKKEIERNKKHLNGIDKLKPELHDLIIKLFDEYKEKMTVTSTYRSMGSNMFLYSQNQKKLVKYIKAPFKCGSWSFQFAASAHTRGKAVDIIIPKGDLKKIAKKIRKENPEFMVLVEEGRWLHIQKRSEEIKKSSKTGRAKREMIKFYNKGSRQNEFTPQLTYDALNTILSNNFYYLKVLEMAGGSVKKMKLMLKQAYNEKNPDKKLQAKLFTIEKNTEKKLPKKGESIMENEIYLYLLEKKILKRNPALLAVIKNYDLKLKTA